MRTFQFLAKQGQHNEIARLLTANVAKPRMSQYSGPRGVGVLIEVALPNGVSKRSVDRMLHANRVPGSVSRANRHLVIAMNGGWIDHYSIVDRIGYNTPFKLVRDGRFVPGLVEVDYYDFGCTCCGGYTRLVDQMGKEV